MDVKERYTPLVIGVNGTATTTSQQIGGFLCKTSGTITVATRDPTPVTLVNAVAVTAGIYTPIPFYVGPNGSTITLAGGASGTLGT